MTVGGRGPRVHSAAWVAPDAKVIGEVTIGEGSSVWYAPVMARAGDLDGLPPTYIDVGSAETFRDDAVAFASRIWAAGGAAELHVWPGGYHGFYFDVPEAALSLDARAARLAWLRRVFGPQ
jgi:acetyl esterase/lipase